MTVDDWKKELSERAEKIINQFEGMLSHIGKLEELEEEFDEDELGAFMLIKLNKMNSAIEKLSDV